MATLYEILADAQHGDAMAELGREFGLTSQQTKAAVAALLPAISVGLKQSTATPEGLGHLFALAAQRPDLFAMYDDPSAAFSREGREAGNDVLATMFGSPEASRAVADQAQQFSGVTSSILKKLLPIIAGMILSGLMKSGSGRAEPSAPEAPSPSGGGLGDILRDMFGQGRAAPSGPASSLDPADRRHSGTAARWTARASSQEAASGLRKPTGPRTFRSWRPAHAHRCGWTVRPWWRSARAYLARVREGDSRGAHQAGRRRPLQDRHPRTGGAFRFRRNAVGRRYPGSNLARHAWRAARARGSA